MRKDFPILEFDSDRTAFIRPENHIKPIDISERAVICFFSDAIEQLLTEYSHEVVAHISLEGFNLPVYELDYKDEKVVLVQAIVGAPLAAGHIENLTAYGCKKYIACGGCGVLNDDIAVGHLIIPTSAIRDEGTSYHYAPPSREIAMCKRAVQIIEATLTEQKVPYIKGKTWTTDACYRETPSKVMQRKQEGCLTVEMEASAFIAVAQYNQVEFGQILYAGDSLGGDEWDSRDWISRTDIRKFVLKLALDACLNM